MKSISVSIKTVRQSMRMDGSYHNADINIYDNTLHNHSSHCLNFYCSNIYTTGRGRRVYTRPERGVPFLSNSDMMAQNPLMSCNYMSRKYGYDESSVLKGGMILTGRVGAIGQTAFVPNYWEKYKMMGSDNIIRIVVKDEFKNGFIYAYLASKYGNLSFWKHATGGVQPFITDKMVANLPIPDFPASFQQEVDDLIQESARLREEAASLLEEAKNLLSDYINIDFVSTSGCVKATRNIQDIRKSLQCRLDPPALMNNSVLAFEQMKGRCVKLAKCNLVVWYPGMFKRAYVKNGLPYMQGSSVFEVNPFVRCAHLAKSRTPKLEELWLKEDLILITCAGSCGQIKLITKEYEDKGAIGSPDIIRIKSMDNLYTSGYLFTYLQMPIVQDYMQSFKYGSVIERFDALRIESIPVIKPTQELSNEITALIKQYKDCTYRAFCAEEKAISMVEQEIESWTK